MSTIDSSSLTQVPNSSSTHHFFGNNFSSSAINVLSHVFVDTNIDGGGLSLNYQNTGALPTDQGLIDKQTLIDRGFSVSID